MRSIISKGNIEGFSFRSFTDEKKNKTKQKTSNYAKIRRSNVVRKPKKKLHESIQKLARFRAARVNERRIRVSFSVSVRKFVLTHVNRILA